MTAPLDGHRVVICRASRDAGPLVARLECLGAEVVSVPMVEPIPAPDGGQALRHELVCLEQYQWLVATSANGSRAVLAELDRLRLPRSHLTSVRLGAVGSVTARVFTHVGLTVAVQATVSKADGLVEDFPPAVQNERVLAPLAVKASDTLVIGLGAKGYRVVRVDAYATAAAVVTNYQRAAISEATAVLFTSSSTVQRFVGLLGVGLVPPVAVSIGPKTTATMKDAGVAVAAEATAHDQEGAVAALVAVTGHS